MNERNDAMVNRLAMLTIVATALGAAAMPQMARAADYDDPRAPAPGGYRMPDEPDLRPPSRLYGGDPWRHGPVVFDARDPDRRSYGPPSADDEVVPRPRRPRYGSGFDGAAPPFGGTYGRPYRAASVDPDESVLVAEPRIGRPDVGCVTEQAESTTPTGWRKTVTRRTCYRR